LEITEFAQAVTRAARVLRVGTGREVKLDGAYVDRLILNIYGGAGRNEVSIDALEIGPVPPGAPTAPAADAVAGEHEPGQSNETGRSGRIQFAANRMKKDGKDWLPSVIDAPGADPAELRRHGFDGVIVDVEADPGRLQQIVASELMLVPRLGPLAGLRSQEIETAFDRMTAREGVCFWLVADRLGASRDSSDRDKQLESLRELVSSLRDLPEDKRRPIAGTVAGDFPRYALAGRSLDLIGVDPAGWASERQPMDQLRYLQQRRELCALRNPQGFFWAWVEASPPPLYRQLIWGPDDPPPGSNPRVQPEQIRLATYLALMAGFRGVAFRGDESLAGPEGRERMLEFALLNAELDLVESMIARGSDPIPVVPAHPEPEDTATTLQTIGALGGIGTSSNRRKIPVRAEKASHQTIRVASILAPEQRGKLLVLADLAANAQWQPPQMAANDMLLRVPCPESAQGFQISLGEMTVLPRARVPGGVEFKLPIFDTTALVLLSTDPSTAGRLEAEIQRLRPRASELLIELATLQFDRVLAGNQRLGMIGKDTRDSADLLEHARELLESAQEARERQDFGLAWSEARRARWTMRHLMRIQFDQARAALEAATAESLRSAGDSSDNSTRTPAPRIVPTVASPALASWETLPRHYEWLDWLSGRFGHFGGNLLSSGSFDDPRPEALRENGWVDESHSSEDASGVVSNIPGGKGDEGRMIRLTVAPRDARQADRRAPFLDQAAAAIRSPSVRVSARQFVRIRVRVKMPRELPGGTGGLIVRDSIGGERLQYATTTPIPEWRELVLYRYIPAESALTVTLGLAGYGEAFFDDLRVERIESVAPVARAVSSNARP
jgi:hypothetical protein